jgi:hypothetical protein
LYRGRNLVERFFNKIKRCRRVATRYGKLAANYLAFIKLAAIRIWLRAYESQRPARSAILLPDGRLILPDGANRPLVCKALPAKRFHFTPDPNQNYIQSRPGPQRGVSRSSQTLGRGCGGRGSVGAIGSSARETQTNDAGAYGEVVWS